MGCNYFLKQKTCRACGQTPEVQHIGKYSCGWTFQFRAYYPELLNFEDWYDHLRAPGTQIVDEYGHKYDEVEFFDILDRSSAGLNLARMAWRINMSNAEKEILLHNPNLINDNKINFWEDNGYSFCDREFS